METRTGFFINQDTQCRRTRYTEGGRKSGTWCCSKGKKNKKKKKKEAFEVCFTVKVAKGMWKPASV